MVTITVPDYDSAIAYFTDVLGFQLIQDEPLSPEKRWVVVSPGKGGADILLARAATPTQTSTIGQQVGGRVGFFLTTTDFWAHYEELKANGVDFIEAPRHEPYGHVVKFRDVYGNLWDLLERSADAPSTCLP